MASAESVAAVIEAGGAHVPELMERLEARLADLARSHGAVLAEHAGSTIAAGGKRLRPLLVLLAAGPSPEHPERVLRAMVAVELIHSATLVHDDVLDAAPRRRGRPTVVATAGRAMATATGDLLFSRAFAELELGPFVPPELVVLGRIGVDGLVRTAVDAQVGLPVAVNADSMATWVLPALAPLAGDVCLDLYREDQEHTSALLRAGTVMAAVKPTSR